MRCVVIPNPVSFQAKKDLLKKGGLGNLHVIADFDQTLTHPRSDTSWSLLKRVRLPQSFHDGCAELFERFHKVEIDSTKTIEERRRSMDEWWSLSHELLLAQKLTKKTFSDAVAEFGKFVFFREHTDTLMKVLKEKGIPLLVLSAGLGDLIDAVIAHQGGDWEIAHVVSNHLVFGEDGIASHFATKNITTFTKNETAITELHPVWEAQVRGRTNVILIGDSVGDASMGEGMPHDCVLRIGFLNAGKEDSLNEFCAAFDIVLQFDDSFDFLLSLISEISSS